MFESPVVSTEWLEQHLNDQRLRVVDIRGHVIPASEPPPHYFAHRDDYEASHIPGAVFVDWVTDITDPDSPNGTQIAQPDAFAVLMSQLGIGDDHFVVVYDDAQGMFAARLWWALLYYGHDQAAVLDGGWNKWVAEGRPTTDVEPQPEMATFTARPNPSIRRTIDQVARAVESGEATLLDLRSPQEFGGEASRARRKGHIPGARNLPRRELVNADDTVPSADVLRERLAAVGVNNNEMPVITYCNAGVSSSYGYLMLRLAGIRNAAVYDGSWKEWGNDPSRPIE